MAGFHTLDQPASSSIAAKTYRSILKPGLHKLIGFAHRTQGLIVAKGNPLRIHTLAAPEAPPCALCQPRGRHRHARAA